MNRIEKINQIGAKMKEDAQNNERIKLEKMIDTENKVKSLFPRIKELIDVAQALSNNNISIGKPINRMIGKRGKFVTEGCDHVLGFFVDWQSTQHEFSSLGANVIGFGIAGGGCCGGDLFIGLNGEIEKGGISQMKGLIAFEDKKMQKLLENFDSFEKEFYEYVDSL